MTPIAAL
jgi:hypothetical protein